MSERTKEVPKLWDLTYVRTLVIESTHKYKVPEPYGSDLPCPTGARGASWFPGFRAKLVLQPVYFAPNPGKQSRPWPLWYIKSWNHMAHEPCIVFTHTFNTQTMSIQCIGKFTKLFGSLRHCFLQNRTNNLVTSQGNSSLCCVLSLVTNHICVVQTVFL